MMSEPQVKCRVCGRVVVCDLSGRWFQPDHAERKLAKLCKAAGHKSDPAYRSGFVAELERRGIFYEGEPRGGGNEQGATRDDA